MWHRRAVDAARASRAPGTLVTALCELGMTEARLKLAEAERTLQQAWDLAFEQGYALGLTLVRMSWATQALEAESPRSCACIAPGCARNH